MKKYICESLKPPKNHRSSAGFTLLELVIAASLTLISMTVAGSGLFFLTQNNKVAKSETERRVELNRATDFIADEIRQAQPTTSVKPIDTNASANLSTAAPTFNSTGKTPVLVLKIPNVSERVIYYVAAKPTGSPWFGPNIVYRWGPSLGPNGQYTNATSPASWSDTTTLKHGKPLVDSIVNTAPSTTPACPSGWTLNPPSGSVTGFYACVDSTGKIASFNLRGTQTDAYTTSLTPYEVSSKAFARNELTATTTTTTTPTFTTSAGEVTINQPSTATFKVLGGDIRCGTGYAAIPTRATIKVTGQSDTVINNTNPASPPASVTLPPLTAATKVTVSAQMIPGSSQNSCGLATTSYNSKTHNGTYVYALKNGESAPNRPAFGGGTSMDTILGPYIDTTNRKIKGLADNQVIYLFELYTTSGDAYDLQDMVVLATIAPS
ncbi:hypothetical protein C7B64_05775 [Merismopedia glauca CCAP 1448/3]|uniref:Uncharacterized protein n=2 Tax=Merismopedia TaxID=53402 RepID=A0A2T1C7C7_9CYAN|nr:hypothetical protein C7B64_05775 [Merismopedia glauca CCAP 1448/3]